jgi:ABC-2 type transport system ATP-binding protein
MNAFSIHAENITKTFGATQALSQVTMNFEQGQMHGIIGPEGAGKTTFIRILLGLLKSAGGQVNYLYNGKVQQYADIRSDIAYMPQSQSLYADLSIGEHLDFFKEMYGISEEDFEVKKTELLQITRLKDFIDRPAGKLSGGMYKKLGLICALLRSPKIIFLDEPTNGVDPISRREFWELLYRLADQNILIILTTAYMDEAERCAVVHLISNGKVVDEGEPKQLLAANGVNSFDELFLKRGHRE